MQEILTPGTFTSAASASGNVPLEEREREEDRDGDQSLSAFQFARSKNGGERGVGLRFCNAIKALLRFSRQSFDFSSDVSAE